MLRKPGSGARTVTATERIVPLDRARTFITLLVVLHHSVVNYTYFGNGDRMRWLGFDLVVLFNDSFVFTGTLSMSWALTVLLRRIPIVARTI